MRQLDLRNRRYYRITDSGRAKYQELLRDWTDYKIKIDTVLLGGLKSE
ncbi:hypothetical protein V7127_04015 [Bacillus sp. JJ1773]